MQWFNARNAKVTLPSKTGLCVRNSAISASHAAAILLSETLASTLQPSWSARLVFYFTLWGRASFRFLAILFDGSPATTYQWVRKTAETLGEPVVSAGVKEIEIDERWHFLHSKKTKDGSSKLWIVTHGELSPGLSVVVMQQRSEDYIASSNTWMIVFSIQTNGMFWQESCRQRDTS